MKGCSPADVAEAEVVLGMSVHEGKTQDVSPLGTHRSVRRSILPYIDPVASNLP